MKVNNSNSISKNALQNLKPAENKLSKESFKEIIKAQNYQDLLNEAFDTKAAKNKFVRTLANIVNSNELLKQCEPMSIVLSALEGEAQNLSLALHQYDVIPYKDNKTNTYEARYQLSYRGIATLALRSGEYKTIVIKDVRQGEYLGNDPMTGDPRFSFSESKDRDKLPLEGFLGYYVLHNGFTRYVYWSHEKILDHANRYSQAFKGKKELYEAMNRGEIKRNDSGSPWFADPLSEPHMKMCQKTIIKQLFNDGFAPLSVEMQRAIKADDYAESGLKVFYANDDRIVQANSEDEEKIVSDVDIVETEAVVEPVKEAEGQLSFVDDVNEE